MTKEELKQYKREIAEKYYCGVTGLDCCLCNKYCCESRHKKPSK